jgi:hypothetical protein
MASSIGRPYRSHLRPACLACRKRKSRCKTEHTADACAMCQVHDTECKFPENSDKSGIKTRRYTQRGGAATALMKPIQKQRIPAKETYLGDGDPHSQGRAPEIRYHLEPETSAGIASSPHALRRPNSLQAESCHLMHVLAETGDKSTHIISPTIVDDNEILERYLSNASVPPRRRMIRADSSSSQPGRPIRPVLFTMVPRRPLGVSQNQSLACNKCEVIEKLIEPYENDLVDM